MKIYSDKEMWSSKREMFWAELKKVLGWRAKCFRLKKMFLGWKKGNTWTEGRKKEALNQKRKGRKKKEEKKRRWTRKEKEEKKTRLRAEIEQREGWNWKVEVLKLKDRGWTGRTETRYIFSIYFPLNLLRKMMVNSFMLDLIFNMN